MFGVCREALERAQAELEESRSEYDRLKSLEDDIISALRDAESRVESLRGSGPDSKCVFSLLAFYHLANKGSHMRLHCSLGLDAFVACIQ